MIGSAAVQQFLLLAAAITAGHGVIRIAWGAVLPALLGRHKWVRPDPPVHLSVSTRSGSPVASLLVPRRHSVEYVDGGGRRCHSGCEAFATR